MLNATFVIYQCIFVPNSESLKPKHIDLVISQVCVIRYVIDLLQEYPFTVVAF